MTQTKHSLSKRYGFLALKAILRVLLAGLLAFVGLYLILMSSMGPVIAPEVWGGRWDIIIRISELVLGASFVIWAVGWLVYPMVKWLYQVLMTC